MNDNNGNNSNVIEHSDTTKRVMLTTLDNPYDPFTQYDLWYAFDVNNGYNSCSYIARIAKVPEDLNEFDDTPAVNQAIDEIVKYNINGLYVKVEEGKFVDRSSSVNLTPTLD